MQWRRILRRKVRKVRKPSREYLKHKEEARRLVKEKLEYFNTFYNFNYGRIAIKNHKRRWGSCSEKGNLNFNYRIVFLPSHLQNYLIVHELSHLGEFNHSPAFWSLVAKVLPDWQKSRKELLAWKVKR